jgi:DNA repair protein RecN (Recombination protein N)
MLLSLSIENFAIVRQVNVEFSQGLSVITGETGAGKSIAIDGLSLCLGARADASAVRKGADKAQLVATFGIGNLDKVKRWLDEHELGNDDQQDECHIRRVISAEGRSKAFINGVSVTLQQLKQLSSQLLAIHGQHAHHHLLKPEAQLALLDSYANHPALLEKVAQSYQRYQETQHTLNALTKAQQQRLDRKQLLEYQVEELDTFALQADEFGELEIEYKRLSNAQDLIENAQKAAYRISEDEQYNAVKMVSLSIRELSEQVENDPALAGILTCLTEAEINLQEAATELEDYCSQLELDPMRMQQVEQRYNQANELARKHAVMPENLHQYHAELKAEYLSLQGDDEQLQSLQQTLSECRSEYLALSEKLSQSRRKAGEKFAAEIVQSVSKMNMPHTQLTFAVEHLSAQGFSALGQDEVNILITTNPGQPLGHLDEVVSGGELSRIGLAIQVITSDQNAIPTLIFDEVDTGISGPTASIIGQLLRTLGKNTQVLCVTHLPQVAAQGHQQLFVNKLTDGKSTETSMRKLDESARVRELARLLAGDEITDTAIANAEELLKKVS